MAKKNMHGKHGEDLLQFGAMVDPEFKAVAQVSAGIKGITLVDLMMDGVRRVARSAGVLDDEDRVVPKYEDSVKSLANYYRFNLANGRAARASRKGKKNGQADAV